MGMPVQGTNSLRIFKDHTVYKCSTKNKKHKGVFIKKNHTAIEGRNVYKNCTQKLYSVLGTDRYLTWCKLKTIR